MGIMEQKMETTIVDWGYIGIVEKKMETVNCQEQITCFRFKRLLEGSFRVRSLIKGF